MPSIPKAADLAQGPVCPVPIAEYPQVLLAHGSGGRLTHNLVEKMFVPAFGNPQLDLQHDGAVLEPGAGRLAFTTDSFVVSPLFFPGGDIGELAIYGTVNDLAMCGAHPRYLSAGFILEEGLPMEILWRVVQSMQAAAVRAGVQIVTGDTKVVERGKGDGIFINTAGIGTLLPGANISPKRAKDGDAIILSGKIGEHGIAILSVRQGLTFDTDVKSDAAPLHCLVADVMDAAGDKVHVLRDPTRGGVASALNEIAEAAKVGMHLTEGAIGIVPAVESACEMLGLDPLYVANEGKCLAIVAPDAAETVLAAMKSNPLGKDAARIGTVVREPIGRVVLRTHIGSERIVDMLSGEQLPRIC